jgi:Uma2 family endonuclease
MSTVEKRERLGIYRMTQKQFKRVCESGIFGDEKVELLAGILFKMPTNPPHAVIVAVLAQLLRPIVNPSGLEVYEEKTTSLGRWWLPLPDIMVVRGPLMQYARRHPGPADITLAVEVSDTTYAKDRGMKYRKYAASRIPVYWIINLKERHIEVFTDPVGRGRDARYRSCMTYLESDRVPILDSSIAVADFLPPAAP